jgi:hypothetical protein
MVKIVTKIIQKIIPLAFFNFSPKKQFHESHGLPGIHFYCIKPVSGMKQHSIQPLAFTSETMPTLFLSDKSFNFIQ